MRQSSGIGIVRFAVASAVTVGLLAGMAGAAQANTTESTKVGAADRNTAARVSPMDYTPVAAYATYSECAAAAAAFPGFATCTYEGGSYPWVLWVWLV
jgi:hypothetical protein